MKVIPVYVPSRSSAKERRLTNTRVPCGGEGEDLDEEPPRRNRLGRKAPRSEGFEGEAEEDEGDGQQDPCTKDVVERAVDVFDLCEDRTAQRADPCLDGPKGDARGDHRTTATPNARRPMRTPRAASRVAKTKRTRCAFVRRRRRVPMFAPVKTPMITMAARVGSTNPAGKEMKGLAAA